MQTTFVVGTVTNDKEMKMFIDELVKYTNQRLGVSVHIPKNKIRKLDALTSTIGASMLMLHPKPCNPEYYLDVALNSYEVLPNDCIKIIDLNHAGTVVANISAMRLSGILHMHDVYCQLFAEEPHFSIYEAIKIYTATFES